MEPSASVMSSFCHVEHGQFEFDMHAFGLMFVHMVHSHCASLAWPPATSASSRAHQASQDHSDSGPCTPSGLGQGCPGTTLKASAVLPDWAKKFQTVSGRPTHVARGRKILDPSAATCCVLPCLREFFLLEMLIAGGDSISNAIRPGSSAGLAGLRTQKGRAFLGGAVRGTLQRWHWTGLARWPRWPATPLAVDCSR